MVVAPLWPTLESFWADITLTAHKLRRSLTFSITAVATLALGIGANTAIFSVINEVLLKPFGYPEPDRIVQFLLTFPEGPRSSASISDFRIWRQQTQAFEQVSA
jgi:putative ABC transport system permease protein